MIRSMTGYARVRHATPLGDVTFSLKSVNHRGLDLHFNLPGILDPFEPALRAVLKRRLARGHVELRASVGASGSAAALTINRALLDEYVKVFKEAARLHRLETEPDLNAAFRIPGMLADPTPADLDPETETSLVAGLETACDRLEDFRIREGAELAADMQARQRAIVEAAAKLDSLRGRAVEALRRRLEERLVEIAAKFDAQRVAQEVALLVERSDIAEEIARLNIHVAQLGELLAKGGEVGKKLDFLLQEMNRETNTILSKTSNAGEAGMEITHLALRVKAEIEKIREQSLNIE